MTTTTLINAASVGASPSDASNITKHTFASTSSTCVLQADITAGALGSPSSIDVRYAVVADDMTANLATVRKLQSAAFPLSTKVNEPLQQKYYNTDMYALRGRYLYVWVQEGTLPAVASLTVKVIEF